MHAAAAGPRADARAILNMVANALELQPEASPLHALFRAIGSAFDVSVTSAAASAWAAVAAAAAAPGKDDSDILERAISSYEIMRY